ncbi:MAG: hypothetical protein AAF492_02240 [Verrucomicrobiota bacterium]
MIDTIPENRSGKKPLYYELSIHDPERKDVTGQLGPGKSLQDVLTALGPVLTVERLPEETKDYQERTLRIFLEVFEMSS